MPNAERPTPITEVASMDLAKDVLRALACYVDVQGEKVMLIQPDGRGGAHIRVHGDQPFYEHVPNVE